jgi:hypothetical protein
VAPRLCQPGRPRSTPRLRCQPSPVRLIVSPLSRYTCWTVHPPQLTLRHAPSTSPTPILTSLPPSRSDCWAVAFGNSYNDEERCVLAGYDNGDVKMFDLRMNKVIE